MSESHEDVEKAKECDNDNHSAVWTIRILYFIGFVDHLGVSMILPILSIYALSLGASPTQAGFIVAVYGGMHIFSSTIMGKMSDDYGRKRIMLLCYTLPCLGYFFTAFSKSLILLALSRIPNGLLEHGVSIGKAYLVDITDSNQRPSVIGFLDAICSMGYIIGPLISGYLAFVDPTLRLSILTGMAVVLLNLFIVYFLLPPSKKDVSSKMNQRKERDSDSWFKILNITKGLNWRAMKDVLLIKIMISMTIVIFHSNFPVYMKHAFSVQSITLGKLLSYNSLIATLSSAACGIIARYYPSSFYQVTPSIFSLFISLLLMAQASTIVQIVAGLSIFSVSVSYFRICIVNLMLESGRGNDEGAILGLSNSLVASCNMLAPALVGMVQEFGSRNNAYLATILSFATMVGILLKRLSNSCTSKDLPSTSFNL